jgi:hypothetical protein
MATIALVATPQPGNIPPRVRLDVTATGTPTVAAVTVTRLDPDGRWRRVRTADDGPQPLTSGTATLYDPEAPAGTPVTYTVAQENQPTASAVLPAAGPWLIHPGVPSRSVPLALRAGSNAEESWDIDQGTFQVLGRPTPVTVNGGARRAPTSSLIVEAGNTDQLRALRLLLSDGSPLFLNGATDLGIDPVYISVGAVRNARQSDIGADPQRDLELPYLVVDRPVGGTRVGVLWSDVATANPSWNALDAAIDSWADLAAPDPNITAVYPGAATFPAPDLYPGG